MEYVHRFKGGPADGASERAGERYNTVILRQLVESGLANMAVYDYLESHESGSTTERIYEFRETLPLDDARAELDDSETH